MSTRPNCSVVITAGSGDQLKGTAWRELAKWHRLALNSDWFEMTATQFSAKENKLCGNCQARTWEGDEDPHKMAGKHAGKDKEFYIFLMKRLQYLMKFGRLWKVERKISE